MLIGSPAIDIPHDHFFRGSSLLQQAGREFVDSTGLIACIFLLSGLSDLSMMSVPIGNERKYDINEQQRYPFDIDDEIARPVD